MTVRIRVLLLAAAIGTLVAAPASAWKGWLENQVIPIARAQEHAESGDRFVIEGTVGVSPELLDLYVRATRPKR
jgi:hypothetical protein